MILILHRDKKKNCRKRGGKETSPLFPLKKRYPTKENQRKKKKSTASLSLSSSWWPEEKKKRITSEGRKERKRSTHIQRGNWIKSLEKKKKGRKVINFTASKKREIPKKKYFRVAPHPLYPRRQREKETSIKFEQGNVKKRIKKMLLFFLLKKQRNPLPSQKNKTKTKKCQKERKHSKKAHRDFEEQVMPNCIFCIFFLKEKTRRKKKEN